MEETKTTIHSAVARRNNFLRENPQLWFSGKAGRKARRASHG